MEHQHQQLQINPELVIAELTTQVAMLTKELAVANAIIKTITAPPKTIAETKE